MLVNVDKKNRLKRSCREPRLSKNKIFEAEYEVAKLQVMGEGER